MEEKEVLVKVEGLSKKFCKDLKISLKYGIKDLFSNFLGNRDERLLREKEFWAIQDISFELRRGECLGLIGHNGAGKSTLLKILNGLIKPDAGKVTIKGKVGALIELGAGFNPILTGRENIYNNGAILGFTRQEIESKVEEIIDFAEIREFIDMPVQNYSSGMKVRLGFAVAAQMEPDVLIIDEVLAVGDLGFRMKCLTKIGSLLKKTAIIFVSHSMPQVSRISNKIMLLHKGKSLTYGEKVSEGIENYYRFFKNNDRIHAGNGKINVLECNFLTVKELPTRMNESRFILSYNNSYRLRLKLKVNEEVDKYELHYSFIDKESKIVATLYSYLSSDSFSSTGIVFLEVLLKQIQLGQGIFSVGLAINEVRKNGANGEVYFYDSQIASIEIIDVTPGVAPIQFNGKWRELKNPNKLQISSKKHLLKDC